MLLAAKIHGTNQAVKATAKRCAKQLPPSKRSLMFTVIDSPQPLQLVGRMQIDARHVFLHILQFHRLWKAGPIAPSQVQIVTPFNLPY